MTNHSKIQKFQIESGAYTLVGDTVSRDTPPRTLVLHGAGNARRRDFRLFREKLLSRGIASAAFDFVGHGDTGGELKHSSLLSRTKQAGRIIEALNLRQPFSVIAASMGAYTAVKLLQYYRIANLILLVPAMYNSAAYPVPFNQGFTQIIRRSRSWENSDAWQILSGYKGRIFIVAGECDQVIPPEVIRRLYDSAANAAQRKLFIAPGASHSVFTDLRLNQPEVFRKVFGEIVAMLKSRP